MTVLGFAPLAVAHEVGTLAQGARVAALPSGTVAGRGEVPPPRILGQADVDRYRKIFALQEDGRWHAADHEIDKLSNRLLIGHVLAQRYLHPTKYRSTFRELAAWLEGYADHPHAPRIYRLASQRQPSDSPAPPRPVNGFPGAGAPETAADKLYPPATNRSTAEQQRLATLLGKLTGEVGRGHASHAERILKREEFRKLADDVEFDAAQREVAHAYFMNGEDEPALELAAVSAARSGAAVPLAHWTAGLAAYRMGKLEVARKHFEALALMRTAPDTAIAAGAFWAARVNRKLGHKPEAERMLRRATAYHDSFYGVLARRSLGMQLGFAWEIPTLTAHDLMTLMRVPAAVRAIALVQVGQDWRAAFELRRLNLPSEPGIARALLALAARLDLPSAQLRLANRIMAASGRRVDGTLYPVPGWTPSSGFLVDRALLYALIRQESAFITRAKSSAGARGLMQLMPRTAAFVARNGSFRWSRRDELFDPELNIELGQRYLLHLLEKAVVDGDLLRLLATYNGGQGNLKKWQKQIRHKGDPLLFIEAIPFPETRLFVERVLRNIWIYRARLGQEAPTLDAVVAGTWPRYIGLDPVAVATAADARR
ncbi:MAG: lytic transglycosylase domain-containing protein [Alphaproteobacteria bacterium]